MASTAAARNDAAPPEEKRELAVGKKLALMALTSAGVALFITGRTAKSLSHRLKSTSPATVPIAEGSLSPYNALRHLAADQAAYNASSGGEADWRGPRRKGELKRMWEKDFRNNRVIKATVKPEDLEAAQEMGFSPALDAFGALSIATLLVILGATGAVWGLGKQWELRDFKDWTLFARYGMRDAMIPAWIKNLRTEDEEGITKDDPEEVGDWMKEVDEEWRVEESKRRIEKAEWEEERRSNGLRVFSSAG